MATKKGFASILILLAVFAVAIVAGAAWIHYVYIPQHMVKMPQTTPVTAVSSSTTAPTVSSPSTTERSTRTIQNGPPDARRCGNSVSCLIAAATDNCSPSSAAFAFPYSATQRDNQTSGISLAMPGLSFTLSVEYRINGRGSERQCSVYKNITGVSAQASPALIQKSLASGMTMAQFNEQLAELNALVSVPKDFFGTCNFTASELAADIHALQSAGLNSETSISTNFVSATTTGDPTRDVCGNSFTN